MPLTYLLMQPYVGGSALEISADAYNDYFAAVSTIGALHDLEELFALIATSGIEIERYLLNLTLDEIVSERYETNQWLDDRYRVNLLILSFFTSVRAYRDQRPKLFETSPQLQALRNDAERVFSEIYKSSFEYRVMEMLRNYSQHARLPLGKISYDRTNEWLKDDPSDGAPLRQRHVTALTFEVPTILKYGGDWNKYDKKVVDELESLEHDSLDARYFIRTYLAQLAVCHEAVRGMCNDGRTRAYSVLKSLPDIFRSSFQDDPGSTQHLDIVTVEGQVAIEGRWDLERIRDNAIERRYVGSELCDRLDYAINKWKRLSNFNRMYISSQLIAKGWSTASNQTIWIPK